MVCYIHNILAFGTTKEEHNNRLEAVLSLRKLEIAGITTLNVKCDLKNILRIHN